MSNHYDELNGVVSNWARDDTAHYQFTQNKPNNIIFVQGQTEMLRVTDTAFYVRGVAVPVDDKEAETVYNAFKEFLVWSRLHRD